VNEPLLRELVPAVIGVLVPRGADFAAAEDAVQDALVEAVRVWPGDPPRDPKGWLVTVVWRKFLDVARADTSRQRREELVAHEPRPNPGAVADDTLQCDECQLELWPFCLTRESYLWRIVASRKNLPCCCAA
jgi:predicted RNA polymerase sigma factor